MRVDINFFGKNFGIEGHHENEVPHGFLAIQLQKVWIGDVDLVYPQLDRNPPLLTLAGVEGDVIFWQEAHLKRATETYDSNH